MVAAVETHRRPLASRLQRHLLRPGFLWWVTLLALTLRFQRRPRPLLMLYKRTSRTTRHRRSVARCFGSGCSKPEELKPLFRGRVAAGLRQQAPLSVPCKARPRRLSRAVIPRTRGPRGHPHGHHRLTRQHRTRLFCILRNEARREHLVSGRACSNEVPQQLSLLCVQKKITAAINAVASRCRVFYQHPLHSQS